MTTALNILNSRETNRIKAFDPVGVDGWDTIPKALMKDKKCYYYYDLFEL